MTKFMDMAGAAYLVGKIKNWVGEQIAGIEATGVPGPAGTITDVTVSDLAPGSATTITLGGTPSARTIALGIAKGRDGRDGTDGVNGTAPTVVAVPAANWPPADAPGVLYVKVP